VDRSDFEEDELPENGVDTYEQDWNTYLATESEWEDFYENESLGEIRPQHSHDPIEDEADYCYWVYENTSGSYYDATSPINVIFDFRGSTTNIDDVSDALNDAGWAGYIAEWTRHAWDSTSGSFVAQEATMASARFGVFTERYHSRYWEFGGYVSMQTHRDDSAWPNGHSVDSYADAESEVRSIFFDESYYVRTNVYRLYNSQGDHNGWAAGISEY
jgi:hypothetical protein